MSERSWTASNGYRYGFNAKEKDDEFSVENGSYDFGARMYDARLGRWWSVDPEFNAYVHLSTYTGMANNPNLFIDSEGRSIVPADAASLNALITFVNNAFASSPALINYIINGTGIGDYGIQGNYNSAVLGIAAPPAGGGPGGSPGFLGSTNYMFFENLVETEINAGRLNSDQEELARLIAAEQTSNEVMVIAIGNAGTTIASVEAGLFIPAGGNGGTAGERVSQSVPTTSVNSSNGVLGVSLFMGSVNDSWRITGNSITVIDQAMAGNQMNTTDGGTANFDINDRIAFSIGQLYARINAVRGALGGDKARALQRGNSSSANIAFQVVNGYERSANGAGANQFTGNDLNPAQGANQFEPTPTDPDYVPN